MAYIRVIKDGHVQWSQEQSGNSRRNTSQLRWSCTRHQFLAHCKALVMDELIRHILGKVSWCMLFTDDIVLIDATCGEVNYRLEVWRQTL